MKHSKRQRAAATPETTPAFPLWGILAILAWTLIVGVWFFRKTRIPVEPILNQWLQSPTALFPTPEASLRHVKHLLALVGVTAALLGIGHRLLRVAGVKFNNVWEELSLSLGLGYGAAGTILFLLGLSGLWSRNLLIALLAGSLLLAIAECRTAYQRVEPSPTDLEGTRFTIPGLYAITGVLIVWLSILRYALIPETFYDALQYHLGLPWIYLLNGRILPTPENSFSGIPGLSQMLYGWTLALDSWGITAYLLHHSMVLWVGVGMMGYCRRIGRNPAAPLALAAFFLVPVVLVESFSISVGMEWALLEFCWFAALVRALTEAPGTADRTKWLILAGAFLGFAMSTKYQAWLLPASMLPLLFIKFTPSNDNAEPVKLNSATIKDVLLVLLVAALCLAPWIVKNIWFYKNPIYPFFHEFFAGKTEYMPNWRAMLAAGTNKGNAFFDSAAMLRYVSLPGRFLFSGDIFHSLGLFAACLAPLLFLRRLSDAERVLAWIVAVSWITLSLTTEITRYFIPHLALATLLICCVMVRMKPLWFRNALFAVAGAFCITFGLLWIGLAVDRDKLDVFLGKKDYGQYLTHKVVSYPSPPYSGIEYINQHTPEDSGVILYGEPRGFYLRRRYRTASDDQPSLLEVWANGSATPEILRARLKAEGVNYILINLSEMERRRLWANVSPTTFLKLAEFWKRYIIQEYEVKVYPERWVVVYRVLDESEEPRPHKADPLFVELLSRFSIPQAPAGARAVR